MNLSHIGLNVKDLERMRYWYMRYFAMASSELYADEARGVRCYFLRSSDGSGAELELLSRRDAPEAANTVAHLAISTGSREGVDFLTELLRTDGNPIEAEPFTAVNGRYISAVLDPEGNRVEITE